MSDTPQPLTNEPPERFLIWCVPTKRWEIGKWNAYWGEYTLEDNMTKLTTGNPSFGLWVPLPKPLTI